MVVGPPLEVASRCFKEVGHRENLGTLAPCLLPGMNGKIRSHRIDMRFPTGTYGWEVVGNLVETGGNQSATMVDITTECLGGPPHDRHAERHSYLD